MIGAGGRAPRRVVVIGVGIVVLLGVTVVIGSMTRWFGLGGVPQQDAASTACLDAVRRDLAAPSAAHFDKIRVREDSLSEDDHVRLGFDVGKVTAVRAVAGVVTSRVAAARMRVWNSPAAHSFSVINRTAHPSVTGVPICGGS